MLFFLLFIPARGGIPGRPAFSGLEPEPRGLGSGETLLQKGQHMRDGLSQLLPRQSVYYPVGVLLVQGARRVRMSSSV